MFVLGFVFSMQTQVHVAPTVINVSDENIHGMLL